MNKVHNFGISLPEIKETHLILRQKLNKITVHLQLLSKSDIIGKKKVVVNW